MEGKWLIVLGVPMFAVGLALLLALSGGLLAALGKAVGVLLMVLGVGAAVLGTLHLLEWRAWN